MGEHCISYSCIFFILYLVLWGKLSKIRFIFLKSCFSKISIDLIWFSINRNLVLKILWAFAWFDCSNLFFDQSNIIFQVLKTVLWLFQNIIFKKFFNFSSLSDLARQHYKFFVVFFLNFCKVFLPQAGKTILSLLLFLFSCFHAFFHAFKGYFRNFWILGFLLIQGLFSEIDHWVLLGYCCIHDCCWLIWSI